MSDYLIQCEYCDNFATHHQQEAITDKDGRRFCSYDCLWEATELRQRWSQENKEQQEIYGNDYDSWYR